MSLFIFLDWHPTFKISLSMLTLKIFTLCLSHRIRVQLRNLGLLEVFLVKCVINKEHRNKLCVKQRDRNI